MEGLLSSSLASSSTCPPHLFFFFFLIQRVFLFVYNFFGCTGSLLLRGLSLVAVSGVRSPIVVCRFLIAVALRCAISVAVAHGLSS